MALILCPECQKEISDQAVACPYCGFPTANPNLQSKEIDGADVKDKNSKRESFEAAAKKKHGTLIAIITIVVLAIAGILIMNSINAAKDKREAEEAAAAALVAAQEAREQYVGNLLAIQAQMLLTAIDAESAGELIHDVWYNTIYEKKDTATDKYTRYNLYGSYVFNSDFNTSLRNLFNDTAFIEKINSIKEGSKKVAELYGKLQNPPDDLVAAFSALDDLYDAFQTLTACATNPSGNLNSYTSSFNQANADFLKYYEKLEAVMPE